MLHSAFVAHVAQHLLDYWVGHHLTNLRVSHSVGHSLLVVAGVLCAYVLLDQLGSTSSTLNAVLVTGLQLKARLERLHRFVVFLLHLMASTLTSPSLYECRVKSDRFFSIPEGRDGVHQLEEASTSVRVEELVLRVALDALIELFQGVNKVATLEKLITASLVLLSDFRVNVGRGLSVFFRFLNFLACFLDVVVVVLEKRLIVSL